jgi:hypothetical protein
MKQLFAPGRLVVGLLAAFALVACDARGTITTPDEPSTSLRLPAQATPVTIDNVYSGPPPWTPGVISLEDEFVYVEILDVEQYLGRSATPNAVRIGPDWATGTPAQQFEVLDINQDGNRDIRLRWSLQQLVNAGHLGANTTQLTVWGRDPGTGQEFTGTASVTVGMPTAADLSTAASNNGSGGIFLDLTPNAPLRVVSFETPIQGTVGTQAGVQVWTRMGSYVGNDASAEGWTLTQTVMATRMGSLVNAEILLEYPLTLAANETTGVYLQVVTEGLGSGIRYTGTAANPPQTTWSNAHLTLFSDVARTGTTPFGGSRFTPRTFSGNVNYQVITN